MFLFMGKGLDWLKFVVKQVMAQSTFKCAGKIYIKGKNTGLGR